jgi:CRP-like cAMP-binding protein
MVEEEKSPEECPNCHASLTFWLEASGGLAEDVKNLLSKIPIFFGIDGKSLGDVARAFREITFAGGDTLVKEGEQSVSFSILTEGKADVVIGGNVIATLQPYQFFGELAALGLRRERSADVVANGTCKCLVAVQPEFQRILSSHPSVASHILSEIRNRYQPKS